MIWNFDPQNCFVRYNILHYTWQQNQYQHWQQKHQPSPPTLSIDNRIIMMVKTIPQRVLAGKLYGKIFVPICDGTTGKNFNFGLKIWHFVFNNWIIYFFRHRWSMVFKRICSASGQFTKNYWHAAWFASIETTTSASLPNTPAKTRYESGCYFGRMCAVYDYALLFYLPNKCYFYKVCNERLNAFKNVGQMLWDSIQTKNMSEHFKNLISTLISFLK